MLFLSLFFINLCCRHITNSIFFTRWTFEKLFDFHGNKIEQDNLTCKLEFVFNISMTTFQSMFK